MRLMLKILSLALICVGFVTASACKGGKPPGNETPAPETTATDTATSTSTSTAP